MRRSAVMYISGAVVAAALAIVGAWLPWVRQRPAGYTDGQPYYTTEYVPGLDRGFSDLDVIIVSLAVAVVVVVVLAHYFGWHPDGIVILVGGAILLPSGNYLSNYWSGERYAVEPGLYILLASGVLFVLLGVSAMLQRKETLITDAADSASTQ